MISIQMTTQTQQGNIRKDSFILHLKKE